MRTHRRAPLLSVLLLAALPLLVVPAPASAAPGPSGCATGRATHATTDRGGDAARGIDITAIGVWHKRADTCVWTVAAGRLTAADAQVVQVLYDTNRSRPGAEAYAFAYSPRDGDERRGSHLVALRGGEWRYLDCGVQTFWRVGKDQIGLGVPKSCLGSPAVVRVKVQVWDITEYRPRNTWRGKVDEAPDGRWSPWL